MSSASVAEAIRSGLARHRAGRPAEAEGYYRKALVRDPGNAVALHLLGLALHHTGRSEAALDPLRRAARLQPSVALYPHSLGGVLLALGCREEAAEAYCAAAAANPRMAEAHNDLGYVLYLLGRWEQAAANLKTALELRPDFAEAHLNLGCVAQAQGRLEEAESRYREAIRSNPALALAHANLSGLLMQTNRSPEAEELALEALRHQPGLVEALTNLSAIRIEQRRWEDAERLARRAVAGRPASGEALACLGFSLYRQGRVDEALPWVRQAVERAPANAAIHSGLLLVLGSDPTISDETLYAEHRRWAERHAASPADGIKPHANTREPERRLRVGYVSADLKMHPLVQYFEPALVHHDRREFEIFCYAEVARPDEVTLRLQTLADHWRFVAGMTDDALAETIRADGIDILVDLNGHTAGHRLQVFARKPAPVQVTWIGYPATTGLTAIDYFLADPWLVPEGGERYFSERVWRLPRCRAAYRPPVADRPVALAPALALGKVTFGCFNNPTKISRAVIRLWSRILQAAPSSRLVLKYAEFESPAVQQRFRSWFAEEGVEPMRIEFRGRSQAAEYLAAFDEIDIALDPFPYNGGTSTFDALWMGVPVIALAGGTPSARLGLMILDCAGLGELVGANPDDYVERAAALAADLPRLAELRASLRDRLLASPWMDEAGVTRDVEQAFQAMWRRWSKG
jgi:predicted O-linked N-acetylglucosamine transferase (SPINDLY family)